MSLKAEEQAQQRELGKLEGEFGQSDIPVEKEVEKEPALTALELAGFAMFGIEKIFQVLAYKRGAHWLLSDQEQEKLHKSLARVVEQYSVFNSDSPWMGLAACAGSIVVGRIAVEQVLIERQKPVAEQEGGGVGD